MARILKPGDKIGDYTIESEINRGNLALAYRAKGRHAEDVFLKAFKSPSPMTEWYCDFIVYQQEMRKRIDSTRLRDFICRILDFFEAPVPPRGVLKSYYQVFEFVARGHDLQGFLDKLSRNPRAVTWETRETWAKVIMASIRLMHTHHLVHGDLKPPNLMLIADKGVKVGYKLKLIDIDYAVMTDRKAPWHGKSGYVGTPGYFSPEHLEGSVPCPASDVFTCGILLSELLCSKHPYAGLGDEEYRQAIQRHVSSPTRLDGRMAAGNDREVLEVIAKMLHPNPAARPSAGDVHDVLNGIRSSSIESLKPPPVAKPEPLRETVRPAPVASPVRPPRDVPPLPPVSKLRLAFESFELPIGITTKLNQRLIQAVGTDSQYWDKEHQFTLERRADGWYLVPNTAAGNETLHNGRALKEAALIKSGDQIGVGRESKGIVKSLARVSVE